MKTTYPCCENCLVISCCTSACDEYIKSLEKRFGPLHVSRPFQESSTKLEAIRTTINMIIRENGDTPPTAKWKRTQ